MRRLAVDRGRWKEFVEAPLTPCGIMGKRKKKKKKYKVLVGKPEGKRPLGRPRCRWEDGIRKDLREIGLDSTVSGQGPVAGFCECGDEPSGSCAMELVS
jgi:hypothetical protein